MILHCPGCDQTFAWAGSCRPGNEPFCSHCHLSGKIVQTRTAEPGPALYLKWLTRPSDGQRVQETDALRAFNGRQDYETVLVEKGWRFSPVAGTPNLADAVSLLLISFEVRRTMPG